MNYLIPNFIHKLCFLLLASLADVHALSKDILARRGQAELIIIAKTQPAQQRQPAQVSLPYPGVVGPEDPSSAAKNANESPIESSPLGIPMGPVGPQHQVDISDLWPQVDAIDDARGWLPPVDPASAARNAQLSPKVFGNEKHSNKKDDGSVTKMVIVFTFLVILLAFGLWYCYEASDNSEAKKCQNSMQQDDKIARDSLDNKKDQSSEKQKSSTLEDRLENTQISNSQKDDN